MPGFPPHQHRIMEFNLYSGVLTVEVPIAKATMSVSDVTVIETPACRKVRPNLSGTLVHLSSLFTFSKH
jgi:hypothetical protein